jgi:hypothetical protein
MTNLTTKTEDSYVLNPRVVYEKHWMMTWCCLTNEYSLTCQVRGSQQAVVLQPLMSYDRLRKHIRTLLPERNDMFQHRVFQLWICDVFANNLSFQLHNLFRRSLLSAEHSCRRLSSNKGFRWGKTLRRFKGIPRRPIVDNMSNHFMQKSLLFFFGYPSSTPCRTWEISNQYTLRVDLGGRSV